MAKKKKIAKETEAEVSVPNTHNCGSSDGACDSDQKFQMPSGNSTKSAATTNFCTTYLAATLDKLTGTRLLISRLVCLMAQMATSLGHDVCSYPYKILQFIES